MTKLWKALSVLALLLTVWVGAAQAQITGTVNLCGGSITFTSGSATADTNTSCTPWETYAYNVGVATPPYSSSIHIPALPNGSANSAAYIPGNALAEIGQANTFTAANTFNGGITVTSSLTATGLVTAADLFGTTGSGGNIVLATSPTVSGLTVTSSFTATGLVTVADLATAAQSTTVNGQTCTLASSCTISAAATSLTVGTTTIASGTNGRIEYNNGNTLGELPFTGALGGAVVLVTSPTISGLTVTGSLTATGLVTNADLASPCCSSITQLGTITSGAWNGSAIPVQYGGTGANLSATGAPNAVVQQVTTGANFTVGVLAASSLSNGVTGSGAIVLATGATLGATTFSAGITASGLPTSGTIANSICSTSAGAFISINAGNCFTVSGAVSSVTGTTGQITASPTTGAVVVSLPATITSSETFSGETQFTGGALVPPVSTPCGASITPTISTQNIECTVTAATTLNVPSPFVAGETITATLQEGATPFPISVAPNITIPGGGIAQLQQPVANDRDMLVCKTTVIGGNNSLDCGQLQQLRQPPAWHVGCHNSASGSISSISCSFTGGYTPPIGSIVLVGFDGSSGTSTSLYSSASFAGGSCSVPSVPANGFLYNSTFSVGYYLLSCQVTTAGATSIGVNFSSSVSGADIFADAVNNSFGLDASNMSTTATASSTPNSGTISPSQQDLVWGWLRCGACGTVTAGNTFTLGQNVSGVGQTEYAILPAGGAPAAVFNAGTAAGYTAGVLAVLP